MQTITIELPTLYGDHHVVQVRKILMELPGVMDVYASSCFHVVEVTYDPEKVNDLEISMKLDEAGYLGEWTMPMETGEAAYQREGGAEKGSSSFFRHTAAYEATRQVISFGQTVEHAGRPLWPCPGMGVIRKEEE